MERSHFYLWGGAALFCAISFGAYTLSIKQTEKSIATYEARKAELLHKKEQLLAQKEELSLQVGGLSDPAFVELILMKELGLVPEGHQKVFFDSQ